jgi:hypothetical protein
MKKADVRDIESLEEYYGKARKIRFAEDYPVNSLDDIYKGLWRTEAGCNRMDTYFMRGAMHCEHNRLRSIDDFLRLAKKYFPELTLKEAFSYLKSKQDDLEKRKLRQTLSYCPNIRKYNYKGLIHSNYSRGIETYNLWDLNHNLSRNLRVSDLLT